MDLAQIFYLIGIVWLILTSILIGVAIIVLWRVQQLVQSARYKIVQFQMPSLKNILSPLSAAVAFRSLVKLFKSKH